MFLHPRPCAASDNRTGRGHARPPSLCLHCIGHGPRASGRRRTRCPRDRPRKKPFRIVSECPLRGSFRCFALATGSACEREFARLRRREGAETISTPIVLPSFVYLGGSGGGFRYNRASFRKNLAA